MPRTDAPLALPVPGGSEQTRRHRALFRLNALDKWRRGEVQQAEMSQEPLSVMQEALVGLADWLTERVHGEARTAAIRTEHQAALHISVSLARFLER